MSRVDLLLHAVRELLVKCSERPGLMQRQQDPLQKQLVFRLQGDGEAVNDAATAGPKTRPAALEDEDRQTNTTCVKLLIYRCMECALQIRYK